MSSLSTLAEIGDRWDIGDALRAAGITGPLVLGPAWDLLLEPEETVRMRGLQATDTLARYDADRHALVLARGGKWPSQASGAHQLELAQSAPPVFQVVTTPWPTQSLAADAVTDRNVRITFDASDASLLQQSCAPRPAFDLARQAALFASSPGFDELLSLPMLRDVELYPHQLKTARTVLRRFRGRALLCDEVGLGKTIEAGLILLELLMRKLVKRVLVLTPSSLVEQWRAEFGRKFGINLIGSDDEAFRADGDAAWARHDRIIASYHKVRREPYRSLVTAQDWDIVIIDEAHHFRNRNTVLWKLANALRKKYALLLTATPVQNNLEELRNLVTLLQPGLLSTAKQFQQQFVDKKDKLLPRNLDQLHGLLAEAMVRNRRSSVSVGLTRRFAQTLQLQPSAEERALYDNVVAFVKPRLRALADDTAPPRANGGLSRMALITLQRELGSSSFAAHETLLRMAEGVDRADRAERANRDALRELARTAETAPNIKLDALGRIAREWDDKLLVFTQFRRTQEAIVRTLTEAGERVVQFHGGMTRMEKEAAVRAFQGEARILVSTESGSEGRNLQFCHALCNFDLPWNPMRIEQRIGRLSRIGQTRDVRVFNLVNAGTIEADVLRVLEAKINLFELVVGEVEMILGNLEEAGEREFEDVILDLWVQAGDDANFRARIDALGEQMVSAKQAYLDQVKIEDKLFANKFEAQD